MLAKKHYADPKIQEREGERDGKKKRRVSEKERSNLSKDEKETSRKRE